MNQTGQPSYALLPGMIVAISKRLFLRLIATVRRRAISNGESHKRIKNLSASFGYGNDSGVRAIIR